MVFEMQDTPVLPYFIRTTFYYFSMLWDLKYTYTKLTAYKTKFFL